MNRSERDRLYAVPREEMENFVFDERVAAVFGDMITRSVPGYATIVAMTGILARRHAVDGSRIYDLGCSLGAASAVMAHGLEERECAIVAVDSAPAMLERARVELAARGLEERIELVCTDIRQLEIRSASVVVLNFTLQFIDPDDRLDLLQRIRAGLLPGGVLLLAEKVAFADPQRQQRMTAWHTAFKKANGYSELEISQKRAALEKVLLPDTLDTHRARLREAGFRVVDEWFRCLNFAGLLAQC